MIVLNGHKSKEIAVSCGVRQGCPLSLLIFNMTTESLATAIRSNPTIEGIDVRDKAVKLSIYADDIVCYLTNSEDSIKSLRP